MVEPGTDYHVPIIPALIKESTAIEMVKSGSGRLVCSRVNYFGHETYIIIYIDNVAGPFEVIPLRKVGVKKLQTLSYIDNFWKRNDLGVPEIVPIETVKTMNTSIPDSWI